MPVATLALFDLDYTLLDGDCEFLWSEYMSAHGLVGDDFIETMRGFYRDYESGTLDFARYQAFLLSPFAHHSLETLLGLRIRYLKEIIHPRIRSSMCARLRWHRAQRHTLLMVTAANAFLAYPIARLLRIPHLICTEIEAINHVPTGVLRGVPSFREGKVTRLRAWLALHGGTLENAWAYSDSHNDMPLLELSAHPVVVTPDDTLRAHALALGWQVM